MTNQQKVEQLANWAAEDGDLDVLEICRLAIAGDEAMEAQALEWWHHGGAGARVVDLVARSASGGTSMKPHQVVGHEQHRLFRSLLGGRWFFCPRVAVLANGVRRVVGKKYDVTEDLQPYLLPEHRVEAEGLGPVERELRASHEVLTSEAHHVWAGARAELRRQGLKKPGSDDITSAAIEAAEALGL